MAETGGFEALKRFVEGRARDELRNRQPQYVAVFQRELATNGGDLQSATEAARPYLKESLGRWPDVLTALFDMEYVRLKLSTCHTLLLKCRDSTEQDSGFWFSYHLDHWIFEADAFVERCKRALTLSVRTLIRPIDPPNWQQLERDLMSDIALIKAELGKVRGKWAHGGGGGVDGLIDEWPPILAAPRPVFVDPEFVRGSTSSLHSDVDVARRQRWFHAIHRSNVLIFAYSEAFSNKVSQHIDIPLSEKP